LTFLNYKKYFLLLRQLLGYLKSIIYFSKKIRMRNKIIIAFLTIMLLGASNSFAYKRGHAVPQAKTETHEKSHITAAHHKGKGHSAHHKGVAMHHRGKGHSHHKGHSAVGHHNAHKKTEVIEEEVFNYPVQHTPVVAAVPVQKERETSSDNDMAKSDRDFKCYRAWKKEMKRQKKEYCAEVKDALGLPWAAERKRRKAYKKAWKADMIEHDYEGGNYYNDRPFWWY
jgi:hypothetical protein